MILMPEVARPEYDTAKRKEDQLKTVSSEAHQVRAYLAAAMKSLGDYEEQFPSREKINRGLGDLAKAHNAGASEKSVDVVLKPFVSYVEHLPKSQRTGDHEYALSVGNFLKKKIVRHELPETAHAAMMTLLVAAITAGTIMLSVSRNATGRATGGDGSMILAAFLLIAMLYFYAARPKKRL